MMEDKDFPALCRMLVNAKSRVNIPETVFFHNESVDLWVCSDSCGLRKRVPGEEGIRTVWDCLRYFQQKAQLQSYAATPACFLLTKAGRTSLDTAQIDSLLADKKDASRVIAVQDQIAAKAPGLGWFHYTLRYDPPIGYTTSFLRVRNEALIVETCARLQHKARDAGKVIINTVEEARLKRVKELRLEFLQDESGALWVMGCGGFSLCQPGPLPPAEASPSKEKALKHVASLRKTNSDAAKVKKDKPKVMFYRGQLRGLESNLHSPIRILSPDYQPESPADNSPSTPGQVGPLPAESPLRSFTTMKTKSFMVKARSERFFNPNFQEMLVMGFLKQKGILPSQHLSTYTDEFFKEIDSPDADSSAKMVRRLTQRLETLALTPAPMTRKSSDSESSMSSTSSPEPEKLQVPKKQAIELPKKLGKKFNATKRELYGKGGRDFKAPLFPVLKRREQPPLTLRFSHERVSSLDDPLPSVPIRSYTTRLMHTTKWHSINSLKS